MCSFFPQRLSLLTVILQLDGGNREQFATPWNYPQPSWSDKREDAYGFGMLEFQEAGQLMANWTWLRNIDPWAPAHAGVVGDSFSVSKKLP